MINVSYLGSLIDTIPNSKEFSFKESDIDCIMKSLNNRIVVDINMSNRSSYLISNVHV